MYGRIGGGTFSSERQTFSSEVVRNLVYAGLNFALNLGKLLLIYGLVAAVIGRWAGWFFLAFFLIQGTESLTIQRQNPGVVTVPRSEGRPAWFSLIAGVLSIILAALGIWWPIGYGLYYAAPVAPAGGNGMVVYWGSEDLTGTYYPLWAVMVRMLILGTVWALSDPAQVLYYVNRIESLFPNYRNTSFRPIDPGSVDNPLMPGIRMAARGMSDQGHEQPPLSSRPTVGGGGGPLMEYSEPTGEDVVTG